MILYPMRVWTARMNGGILILMAVVSLSLTPTTVRMSSHLSTASPDWLSNRIDELSLYHVIVSTLFPLNRGSVMFLIKTSSGKCYLHTGDYRYSPEMVQSPSPLIKQWIDIVYMDVTFCHPSLQFPSEKQSALNLGDFIKSKRRDKKWRKKHNLSFDTIYIWGRMGVESLLVELCDIFNTKMWVDPRDWKYKHFTLFPSTAPYVTR